MQPFIFMSQSDNKTVWIVFVATWSYSPVDVAWMNYNGFLADTHRPSIDIMEKVYHFDTESKAIEYVKNWWTTASNKDCGIE